MKSRYILLVSLVGLFLLLNHNQEAEAATAMALYTKSNNSKYPDHCELKWGEETNYYPIGTHHVEGECTRVTCNEDFSLDLAS